MKKSIFALLTVFAFMSLFECFAVNHAMTIAENGRAQATIVVADGAPYKNRLAAKELKCFLDRISGADFVIKSDKSEIAGPKILVGPSRYTAKMKLDIPSGQSYDEIREGFIIKTVGNDLVLAGNDDGWLLNNRHFGPGRKKEFDPSRPWRLDFGGCYKGTLFAVYAFLEHLGCRWYMPGKIGEVVPHNPTITIGKLDMFERPGYLFRGYWLFHTKDTVNDLDAFFNRNRFLDYNAGFGNALDGSIHRYITNDMFKTNPEYFGLTADGKGRDINTICMSNPDVEDILVRKIKAYFKQNPQATFAGFAPKDGHFACHCAKCLALNSHLLNCNGDTPTKGSPSISGSYYRLICNVASRLKTEYPDRIISASIYAGRVYTPPSEFKFPDNVAGYLALIQQSLLRPISDPDNIQSLQIAAISSAWKRRMKNYIYRPYYPNFFLNLGLPIPQMHNIISDVKYLAHPERQPLGFRWECRPAWNNTFLNIYMLGRMLWNPAADGEKILDEAYSKLYGPAAVPVKKFYTALEETIRNLPFNTHEEEAIWFVYNHEYISSLMPLISEAERLTSGIRDESLQRRIAMLKLTAEHLLVYSEMRSGAEMIKDYTKAIALAEKMQEIEEKMYKISPVHIDRSDYRHDLNPAMGEFGANRSSKGKEKRYRSLKARRDGTVGKLAVDFPKVWKFKTDRLALGIAGEWFRKDHDISTWNDILVPCPIEYQGYHNDAKHMIPYMGEMFYAVDFDLPENCDPDKLTLLVGGINNEAWIWFNGQIAAHQPFNAWWSFRRYTWEKDIAPGLIKRGRNRIVIRVISSEPDGYSGIFRNIFLYRKTTAAKQK